MVLIESAALAIRASFRKADVDAAAETKRSIRLKAKTLVGSVATLLRTVAWQRKAQRPENITPARVYPESVMFEWPSVIGPDSGGVSWAHPWKSKMTITAHAVTIRRRIFTLTISRKSQLLPCFMSVR